MIPSALSLQILRNGAQNQQEQDQRQKCFLFFCFVTCLAKKITQVFLYKFFRLLLKVFLLLWAYQHIRDISSFFDTFIFPFHFHVFPAE